MPQMRRLDETKNCIQLWCTPIPVSLKMKLFVNQYEPVGKSSRFLSAAGCFFWPLSTITFIRYSADKHVGSKLICCFIAYKLLVLNFVRSVINVVYLGRM